MNKLNQNINITVTILLTIACTWSAFGQKKTSTAPKSKNPQKSVVKGTAEEPKALTADEFANLCPKIVQTTTDKMTDQTFTTTKGRWSVVNENTGFGLLWVKRKDIILLSLSLVESGTKRVCVPESTKLIVLFTDGTKVERRSFNDFNCDGKIALPFDQEKGDELAMKLIETVRVYTQDGFIQVDFSRTDQVKFFTELNCLFLHKG